MTWTLQKYLLRDLLKTAALAIVAFTLVITMFAVMEPLRKLGLAPLQVLRLFWYMVPVMLSLTLPIAVLFAATMTYGRFAMDNELLACRASGVSTYALLKPALALGLVVTAMTLLLSNWVAPLFAQRAERIGTANMSAILYQGLRTRSYWQFHGRQWIIHAADSDPANNILRGVVAIDYANAADVRFIVASSARVDFREETDETVELDFTVVNPVVGRQFGWSVIAQQGPQTVGNIPLPSLFQEDPAFYNWGKLLAVRADPQRSQAVLDRLENIRRELFGNSLFEEMAEAIDAGEPYELIGPGEHRYVFTAPDARVDESSSHLLLSSETAVPEGERPVRIDVYAAGGELRRTVLAERVELSAQYVPMLNDAQVAAALENVLIIPAGGSAENSARHREHSLGPLIIPRYIRESVQQMSLRALYNSDPDQLPRPVVRSMRSLQDFMRDLTREIIAEMHSRISYGVGCFLLIGIGAGMGLIFRGGHILSAFALGCIPAMVLIVLTLMGKEMVTNPGVSPALGLGAIWAAVAILAAMFAYLYLVALRR